MGGIPSRESSRTLFSMEYGTHEIALIPLTRQYFGKVESPEDITSVEEDLASNNINANNNSKAPRKKSSDWVLDSESGVFNNSVDSICISSPHAQDLLRKQFIQIRNDPCIRYFHIRNYNNPDKPFDSVPMNRLPGYVYSEDDLDKFLNFVEEGMFNTNEEFLAAGDLRFEDHRQYFDETYPELDEEGKRKQFEICKVELGAWDPEKELPERAKSWRASSSEEEIPIAEKNKAPNVQSSVATTTYAAPSSLTAIDEDFEECKDPNIVLEHSAHYRSSFETYLFNTYPEKWNHDGEKKWSYGSLLRRALCPVPVAAAFICPESSKDSEDGILLRNKRVNLIGYFGFSSTETVHDRNIPYLQPRKVMVKAAGDRTLERVVLLAARYYMSQFSEAAGQVYPTRDPLQLLYQRIRLTRLVLSCKWNNYPTLKFLYDLGALLRMSRSIVLEKVAATSVDNVEDANSPFHILSYLYKKRESDEKGINLLCGGEYYFHIFMYFMRYYVLASTSACGCGWAPHLTTDVAQVKDRKVVQWLLTSELLGNKDASCDRTATEAESEAPATEADGAVEQEGALGIAPASAEKARAGSGDEKQLNKGKLREELLEEQFGYLFEFDPEESAAQTSKFLGSICCTQYVAYQLHMLHQEIIASRKVPQEDPRWGSDHAFSDNLVKHYGIFCSALSGPFLTAVQTGKPATSSKKSKGVPRQSKAKSKSNSRPNKSQSGTFQNPQNSNNSNHMNVNNHFMNYPQNSVFPGINVAMPMGDMNHGATPMMCYPQTSVGYFPPAGGPLQSGTFPPSTTVPQQPSNTPYAGANMMAGAGAQGYGYASGVFYPSLTAPAFYTFSPQMSQTFYTSASSPNFTQHTNPVYNTAAAGGGQQFMQQQQPSMVYPQQGTAQVMQVYPSGPGPHEQRSNHERSPSNASFISQATQHSNASKSTPSKAVNQNNQNSNYFTVSGLSNEQKLQSEWTIQSNCSAGLSNVYTLGNISSFMEPNNNNMSNVPGIDQSMSYHFFDPQSGIFSP